jgi:hypothetical protein
MLRKRMSSEIHFFVHSGQRGLLFLGDVFVDSYPTIISDSLANVRTARIWLARDTASHSHYRDKCISKSKSFLDRV